MAAYVLRRLPAALVTLFLASVGIFLLITALPGNPAELILGDQATPEAVAALEEQLGLDQPLVTQYAEWIGGLLRGDLGSSYLSGEPIAEIFARGAAATAELAIASLALTLAVGFLLGAAGATARRGFALGLQRTVNALLFGVPEYVVGVVLILVFAVTWRLLPAGGREPLLSSDPWLGVQFVALPAIALSLHSAAVLARFLETSLRQSLAEDFVETATAKGVGARRVLWRHALPNSLPPVLTVIGLRVGHLLGVVVVIESIFNWPGLGQTLTTAVVQRDYRVVQDLVLFSVALFIAVQVLTDVLHARLDPRLRLGTS
jgi:peptide/nickel transport system permease protein